MAGADGIANPEAREIARNDVNTLLNDSLNHKRMILGSAAERLEELVKKPILDESKKNGWGLW